MPDGRYLLDANVLFWFGIDQARLSSTVTAILARRDGLLVSPLSTNELALKASKGKLRFPVPVSTWVEALMNELGATSLPLLHEHVALVETLPWHHRDPFDRLLIAQALAENVAILSSDQILDRYGVTRIW